MHVISIICLLVLVIAITFIWILVLSPLVLVLYHYTYHDDDDDDEYTRPSIKSRFCLRDATVLGGTCSAPGAFALHQAGETSPIDFKLSSSEDYKRVTQAFCTVFERVYRAYMVVINGCDVNPMRLWVIRSLQ